eukprot:9168582-Pyramimonas_sp.AAC.2
MQRELPPANGEKAKRAPARAGSDGITENGPEAGVTENGSEGSGGSEEAGAAADADDANANGGET